ncbi:uncharacterized protein LOC113900686 [Bos indicus x Bos taurus]|uniref:uncharacterized protein LOC113900686 n=1 Tax=Bos indicus x Bos taurus TaxID=30522 RepID=UPI000F7D0A67|nr:uncharacterized protein LOC113900686 [Bos indicus x Bos taurus]
MADFIHSAFLSRERGRPARRCQRDSRPPPAPRPRPRPRPRPPTWRRVVACGEAGRAEAPWEPAHHIPSVGTRTRAPCRLRLAPGKVRARLRWGGDGSHSAPPRNWETAGPFRRHSPPGIPAQDPGRRPRAPRDREGMTHCDLGPVDVPHPHGGAPGHDFRWSSRPQSSYGK